MRLAIALGVVATGSVVRAEKVAATSSLGWVRSLGAESCIGPKELAAAVEQRLGREVFVSTARAELAVEGSIEHAPTGQWRARIAITNDLGAHIGTRELASSDASCRALDDELVLAIGLMIDPDAMLAGPPRSPSTPPVPVPAPPIATPTRVVVSTVRVPVPCPAPPQPEPWRVGATAGAAFVMGLLPNPAIGLRVGAHLTPPSFPAFEIGGAFWSTSRVTDVAQGGTFSLVEGFIAVCPLTTSGAGSAGVRLSGCAGARLGALRAVGFGFDRNAVIEGFTAAASVEGRASRRLAGPLLASLGVGIAVPFVRDRFFFDDAMSSRLDVFRMSPVAGLLDLALGLEVP